MGEEDTTQEEAPVGGLGALGLDAGALPGQSQLDQLVSGPLIDPSTKWLKFAAGALSRPGERYGVGLGGALGGMAESQTQEAELRAKYLPIAAAAMLQRQQMALSMSAQQYKLTRSWDDALTSQLTGLLTRPKVSIQDAYEAIGNTVRQGGVPPQFATQYFRQLPQDSDSLRTYIRGKAISLMKPEDRVGAISPKVELKPTEDGQTGYNTNPNAPVGVGPVAPGTPSQLKPTDKLPKTVETPRGPMLVAPTTGKAAYVGSPEAPAVVQEGMGTPPTALPAPPGQPTPQAQTPPAAPSTSAQVSPSDLKAEEGAGANFAKYEEDLNNEVSTLSDLSSRIKETREYLSKFRTGANAEIRSKAAAFAKDLALSMGASQGYADALGNGLAGGDLASAQAFQKLSVQGAMEALKVAAGAGQRFTQAEYAQFLKTNPNLDVDPRAIEKINNFLMTKYRQTLAEQSYVAEARAAGVPVEQIRAGWSRRMAQLGYQQPTTQSNKARGTVGASSEARLGTSVSGRKMRQVNGVWEYE